MKCLLCPKEIDELKEFPVVYDESARRNLYDEIGQRKHSAELNQWQQVVVAVGAIGERTVLHGHVCPEETFENIALTKGEKHQ